ncbi:MAG TPA: hypothetical protein VHC43_09595 [Mycobacteriales bacterium]|nr:hypothetical protein [Mycobacteriales bacterium]
MSDNGDIRADAESIIGADRPSERVPVEPPPNPAIGPIGLLLSPYRKWVVKLGLPLCAAAIIYSIVSGGGSRDSARAAKMCDAAMNSVSSNLAGSLMSVDSTTAVRLRRNLASTGNAGAASLATAPADDFVALCTIKDSNAGGGTVTVAVLPNGSVIRVLP